MLSFECKCTKLCFSIISLAVFAQYEDHLSIYDWCPDQTLWDWLPGVACSLFPDALSETLGSYQGCWLHGILFTRSYRRLSQSETWKQAIWDNYLSYTPMQCSESPACSFEQRRPVQVHLKTVVDLVVTYGNMRFYEPNQEPLNWKCFFLGFFLAFSCYSGGLQQYCQYFDVKWQWIMAVRFFLQQFLLFCSNLTVSF